MLDIPELEKLGFQGILREDSYRDPSLLYTLRIRRANPSARSIKCLSIPKFFGRDEQYQKDLEDLVPNLILTEGTNFVLFASLRHIHYLFLISIDQSGIFSDDAQREE